MIVTVQKVPFKLRRDGRPINLEVNIRNNTSTVKKYVVSVEVGRQLSLNPSGLAKFEVKRTGNVLPGEKKGVIFSVYAKPTATEGKETIKIRVDECIDDYDNIITTREMETTVDII